METDPPSYQNMLERLKRAEDILEALRLGEADAVIGERQVRLLRLREAEEKLTRTIGIFKKSMEILDALHMGENGSVVGENKALLQRLHEAEDELRRTNEEFKLSVAGDKDFVASPINLDEVRLITETVSTAVRTYSELEYLRDEFWKGESRALVHTLSTKMKKVFDQIRLVAPTTTAVLLTGETGTGKGILAKLIHRHSHRADSQFISVHCGAIPETLIESELFGHEKGAFTGAIAKKLGKFEIAQGGTLFLDEIGTITPSVQIKLLQVLQEKVFSRVGGELVIKADVRIIAATNSNLQASIKAGTFREDLFYRLNVFPIEVPPLRERIEDIPILVKEFLANYTLDNNKGIVSVHPQVLAALSQYPWPGNIRELENLIERAHIIEQSQELTPESFPSELFSGGSTAQVHLNTTLPLAEARREAIESVERQYLKQLMAEMKGKVEASARAAGLGVRQLHNLLTKYKITKDEFKESDQNDEKDKSET